MKDESTVMRSVWVDDGNITECKKPFLYSKKKSVYKGGEGVGLWWEGGSWPWSEGLVLTKAMTKLNAIEPFMCMQY